jgi:hypothetical protein
MVQDQSLNYPPTEYTSFCTMDYKTHNYGLGYVLFHSYRMTHMHLFVMYKRTPHAHVVMCLVTNAADRFSYKKSTAQLVTLMIILKMKALSSTTLSRSYALDILSCSNNYRYYWLLFGFRHVVSSKIYVIRFFIMYLTTGRFSTVLYIVVPALVVSFAV